MGVSVRCEREDSEAGTLEADSLSVGLQVATMHPGHCQRLSARTKGYGEAASQNMESLKREVFFS